MQVKVKEDRATITLTVRCTHSCTHVSLCPSFLCLIPLTSVNSLLSLDIFLETDDDALWSSRQNSPAEAEQMWVSMWRFNLQSAGA
jgi:hypothetical protein